MGSAVRDENLHGGLPDMAPNGPDFLNSSMMLSVSVERCGATLARWIGVDDAGFDTLFARLGGLGRRDPGFLTPEFAARRRQRVAPPNNSPRRPCAERSREIAESRAVFTVGLKPRRLCAAARSCHTRTSIENTGSTP